MFIDKRVSVVASVAASAFLLVAAAVVLAQETAPTSPATEAAAPAASAPTAEAPAASLPAKEIADKALSDLWDDMIHYIRIARGDLAKSYAQAILDRKPKAHDIYVLSVKATDTRVLLAETATKLEGMRGVVDQLLKIIEQGYQEDRSNPEQIASSIAALSGGLQAYENASARLVISGEYAVPQMIQTLADPKTPSSLKELVATVLPKLSKDSVNALAAALNCKDDTVVEVVARALGSIGYRQAAPYLKATLERKNLLDNTKKAVTAALVKLVGQQGANKSLAELAYESAQNYFNNEQSLTPPMGAANVWSWQNDRVTYDRVPNEIYTDVYAMQLAAMALNSDPKYYPAMSLWLAADFRREANLPNGLTDPTQPANMPAARFFALASPPEILQDVLSIGMKQKNSAVIMGAMQALVRTQGAKSLVQPVGNGAQPLVEALRYADRRVRYMAAVSLADALPEKRFSGSDQVVNVLIDALRGNAKKVVLLVVLDDQLRNNLKNAIRTAGYEVIDQPDSAKALVAAQTAPVLDAVVTAGKASSDIYAGLSRNPILSQTPVVLVGDGNGSIGISENEGVLRMGAADKVADVLAKAVKTGTTEAMPADEVNAWALKAANTTRTLAYTGNVAFELGRIRPILIDAVTNGVPEVQMAAAKALAAMSNADGQQAITGLATRAGLDDKTRIEALNVLTDSVRKFGNQLTDDQVKAIYDLVVGNGAANLKEAAAQALGSLNLPSEKSRALILQFSTKS